MFHMDDNILVVDKSGESPYDASFLTPNEGYVQFFNLYDNGNLEEVLVQHGDKYEEKVVTCFYENGLLKSVSGRSMTIAFSNYVGHKVDVAIVFDGEMFVIKELECDGNFDEFISDSVSTRAIEQDELYDYIVSQFQNLGEYSADMVLGSSGWNIVNYLGDIVVSSLELLGFREDRDVVVDLIVDNLQVLLEIKTFMAANPTPTPWGILCALIMNYPTYVQWVEDTVYAFLELYDNYKSDQQLALSTLNSGFGALKATLSWDFYADIDLHAVEPDGSQIYWKTPYSVSGGFLDVDNRAGGEGSVENIYWEHPLEGTYRFYVNYYGKSVYNDMEQCGVCRVAILYNGRSIGVHSIPIDSGQAHEVQTITLQDGIITKSAVPDMKFEFIINREDKKDSDN